VAELYDDREKFALICSGLGLKASYSKIKPLAVAFAKHSFARGAVIYSQRDPADSLVLIASGEVELVARKKDQPTKELLGSKHRLRHQLSPYLLRGNTRVSPVCLASAGQLLGEEAVLRFPHRLCEAVVVSDSATTYQLNKEHFEALFALLAEESLHLKFTASCERKVEMLQQRLQKLDRLAAASTTLSSEAAGLLASKAPSLPNIRFNFKPPHEQSRELSVDLKLRLKSLLKRSELLEPQPRRPKLQLEASLSTKARMSLDKSLQSSKNKQTSILASGSRRDSGVLSPPTSKQPEKCSQSTTNTKKPPSKLRSLQELFRIARQPIAVQLNEGPVQSPLLTTGRLVLLEQTASPHANKKRMNDFSLRQA